MLFISPCRSVWIVACSALAASGCGPRIKSFDVAPRRVCAGDTVRIAFETRGRPRLVTVRHGGADADTTTYTLVAEAHGKTAYSAMDVVTFSPGAVPLLAFDTDLLGEDSLVARDSLRAETWHGQVRVGAVFADSGRALVVSHGDKEALVQPGPGGSAALRGTPISGPWELRAGLLSGEVPGDPNHHPPAHLYLRVGVACGGEGAAP